MENGESRKVYEAEEIYNYKELLDRVQNKFSNNMNQTLNKMKNRY